MSLALFGVLSLLFEKTRWGLKLTAVAEDHAVSQSMGISVKRSIAIAWIISCLLSAWAAVVFLNGMTLTFAAGTIGLAALPVALLAGLESIWGAPVAGLIVGIGESLAAAYLDEYTRGRHVRGLPLPADAGHSAGQAPGPVRLENHRESVSYGPYYLAAYISGPTGATGPIFTPRPNGPVSSPS